MGTGLTVVRQRRYLSPRGGKRDSRARHIIMALAMAAVLAAAGWVVYLSAGAGQPWIHLAYIPILGAAVLLELPGALLSAAVASIVLGLLAVTSSEPATTGPEWLTRSWLYLGFGALSGGLIRLHRRRVAEARAQAERLSSTCTRVLASLAQIVEGRDERARGHCDRVAQNTVMLGRQLGFNATQLETLYWGALLHDLGKIAIPEQILLKPSGLTDAEYAEVKLHAQYGADLLEAMSPEFGDIAKVVLHHHERWDGAGYPRGLAANDIPLMSRMVTLMDVFEALTSERPYRRPMPAAEALNYIRAQAGRHFDPQLVDAFEELFRRGRVRVAGERRPADPAKSLVEDVRATRSEYSFN